MAPPSGNRRPSPGVKPLKSTNPGKKTKPRNQISKASQPKSHDRSHPEDVSNPSSVLPLDLQQLVLNIFRDTFASRFNDTLPSSIQAIKKCLYNRDFANAFGKEEYLEAYAMRWSPSRALAYMDIFCSLPDLRSNLTSSSRGRSRENQRSLDSPEQEDGLDFKASTHPKGATKILCLGGGAGAEVAALAGYLRYLNTQQPERGRSPPVENKPPTRFEITAIDIADWSAILHNLSSTITIPPSISQYASPAAKASGIPLVSPDSYSAQFLMHDLLNMEVDKLAPLLKDTSLVTLMFTLNELYTTSMSSTTTLLLSLTFLLAPGSLLLVVDSPGSYSTVSVGNDRKAEKKYPMQWLLDHTLLESSALGSSKNSTQERQWEKLESCGSRWFRLGEGLRYGLDLEDMRYQVHLYRKV